MLISKIKKLSLVSTFAQIIILVLIIPLLVGLISVDDDTVYWQNVLTSFAGGLSLGESWIDLLSTYFSKQSIDASNVVEGVILVFFSSFIESLIIGVIISIFQKLHVKLGLRGKPILLTFAGCIVGALIIFIIKKNSASALKTVLLEIGAAIITLIGLVIMVKTVFRSSWADSAVGDLIRVLISCVMVVLAAGYFVILNSVMAGTVPRRMLVLAGGLILGFIGLLFLNLHLTPVKERRFDPYN